MKISVWLLVLFSILIPGSILGQFVVSVKAGLGTENYYRAGYGAGAGFLFPSPLPLFNDQFYLGIRGDIHSGSSDSAENGNTAGKRKTRVSYIGIDYGPVLATIRSAKIMFSGIIGAAIIERERLTVNDNQSSDVIEDKFTKLLLSPGLAVSIPVGDTFAVVLEGRFLRVAGYNSPAAYGRIEMKL